MPDIALVWDPKLGVADMVAEAGDLRWDDGLRTAYLLSFFCDQRADDDDPLPGGPDDKRGWWADELLETPNDKWGSKLWLLERAKATEDNRKLAEQYALEAVKWLIEDRVVLKHTIVAELQSSRLALQVVAHKPNGEQVAYKFSHVWGAVDPPQPVVPAFSVVVNDLVATVTNLTSGVEAVAWEWDWGDSTERSTAEHPAPHTYATVGAKTLILTVTDQYGFQHSVEQVVTPDLPKDGPGLWYVPVNAAEFEALGLVAPDYLVLCQEASGALAPAIDALSVGNLAVNSTGHLYQQSVTGWTRKFVGFPDGGAGRSWRTSAAALALASGESFAVLAYLSVATSGSARDFWYAAGANNRVRMQAGNGMDSIHNSGAAAGLLSHSDITTVHQMVWQRDGGDNISGLVTDLERILATHAEEAVGSPITSIGNGASGQNCAARFTLFAIYKAAKAEQDWVSYCARLRNAPMPSTDGPSGWYVPTTKEQAARIGIVAHHLWACQEASGDLADAIAIPSAATLADAGTTEYQQTVSNWTRKAARLTETANEGFFKAAGGGVLNAAADSCAWLVFVKLDTHTAGNRRVLQLNGGGGGAQSLALGFGGSGGGNNGKLSLSDDTSETVGTSLYNDGLAHPVVVVWNKTTGIIYCYTDKEQFQRTVLTVPTVEGSKGFGGSNVTTTPSYFLLGAAAAGPTAESWGKATLEALGVDLPY